MMVSLRSLQWHNWWDFLEMRTVSETKSFKFVVERRREFDSFNQWRAALKAVPGYEPER